MRVRLLPNVRIPIIEVDLPAIELPEFPPKPLKLDERQVEVLRYALMDDLSDVIPIIGDVLSDVAYAELRKRLTPEEYERFVEENKWLPSTLAVIKVFAESVKS
ncbi:MAG: hypothetical protein QXZ56_07590 [Sulfolobales archaeon]